MDCFGLWVFGYCLCVDDYLVVVVGFGFVEGFVGVGEGCGDVVFVFVE